MEYQHGGDIYTNHVKLDFSANINPLGMPKKVKDAAIRAVEASVSYPDSRCGKLKQALSEFHEVRKDWLICGNGAADLIFQAVLALKPKQAVLISPSFLEYEQALKAAGSQIRYFELTQKEGFVLSASKLLSFLKAQRPCPQMLFLCNPNNPTGLAVKKEDLRTILAYAEEEGIFCVVDECFNEFLTRPQEYSVLEYLQSGLLSRVFILKAFTKLYAIPGLRLGYGICPDVRLLEQMEELRQPWSVSIPAQAAGQAALGEREFVEETRKLITRERSYLQEGLTDLGFAVYDSCANYLFFRDKRPEAQGSLRLLYEQCLERGVLIRSCKNYRGLDGTYYRICVRKREENQALFQCLKSILTEGN